MHEAEQRQEDRSQKPRRASGAVPWMAQGLTARSSDVRAQRFAIPARRTMQEQTYQRRASRPAPQALLYRRRSSPAPGRAPIRPTHRHIDLANVVADRRRRGTEQLVRLRSPQQCMLRLTHDVR